MMRSMFSGVSGLRVHQTKMDVIANNISNVNTIGFKSSRATFQEVFNQTLSSATKAAEDGSRGGVNPSQLGLGSAMGSIDLVMTRGIPQRTDWAYDVMIDGEGFFVVTDASGTYFTRAGAFRFDESGNLTNPNGMLINGWTVATNDLGERVVQKGPVQPIKITAEDEYIAPTPTSYIRAQGNLNAYREPERETKMSFFDSLGNSYEIPILYAFREDEKVWDIGIGNYITVNGDPENRIYIGEGDASGYGNMLAEDPGDFRDITTGSNPFVGLVLEPPDALPAGYDESNMPRTTFTSIGSIKFNENGYLFNEADAELAGGNAEPSMTSMRFTLNLNNAVPPVSTVIGPDVAFSYITLNFDDLTQFDGASTATNVTMNGNEPGTLTRTSIGPDGILTGSYSNGETKIIAQIAVTTFTNPAGLEKVGNNLFMATRNSGDFDGIGLEVYDVGASMLSGVLEMSNVDIAAEFTEMITTQRGFQANSRTITTSDEMLQELVNLKR